jgi:hypothetical protein
MALVAAVAAALLFWTASFGARQQDGQRPVAERFAFVSDEVVFGAGEGGAESAVLADGGQLSHDEILSMVVSRAAGREGMKR